MGTVPIAEQLAPDVRRTLVDLRRAIHREPELAFEEHRTAERLEHALRTLGVDDVRRVAGTGLLARIRGRQQGTPVVAIRGDIDALPIREATGLEFASTNDGVMHACGHDVHASWAVGAAALLAREPADGDVLVVLQPAEETGKGALAIMESGALDEVAAIFGGHVDRRFAVGEIVADDGPLAASADTFAIEIVGQGAHAARPHESRDVIVAAAAIVSAIQSIVARRLNPAVPGVVTVATIHAGTAPNVISDRATLSGTVRAVDDASRELMLGELKRVTEHVAAGYSTEARVTFELGTPPLVNAPRVASWARAAAASVVGAKNVVPLGFVNMAAEDFACYLQQIPGCFMRIGAREANGAMIPAHAPTFYAAEESLFVGSAVLAACARTASRELMLSH